MRKRLRGALQRQQRIGYFVIALLLLAPAVAFGQRYGLVVVLALWAGFVIILEYLYRWLITVEARNRRKWWAKQRKELHLLRLYVVLALLVVRGLFESPFARYTLVALAIAGLISAGIIRLIRRGDETPTAFPGAPSPDDPVSRTPD